MADEEDDFPSLGEIDWSEVEHAANNDGSTEGMTGDTVEHMVLSPEMIGKRVLWNVLPHNQVEDAATFLGLPSVSEEGLDSEHQAAHERIASIVGLAPYVAMLSVHATRAAVAAIVMEQEGVTPDHADFVDAVEKLEPVVLHCTLSTIEELLEYGALHTPHFQIFDADDLEKIREALHEEGEEG